MDLATYLQHADLTQAEFAARLGVHPVTLNRWVKGHAMPRRAAMAKIQNLTGGCVLPADLATAATAPSVSEAA
jgi:DNA-binding transcriptional regulator YdaS (Cro superfamily)